MFMYRYCTSTVKGAGCYILQYEYIFLCIPHMLLTSGRAFGRKTLLQYTSLTPLERECYEVQPYRKTDYKLIIYIYICGAFSRNGTYVAKYEMVVK